jgi:RNA polymerase sigma factor (sigma-70 family)
MAFRIDDPMYALSILSAHGAPGAAWRLHGPVMPLYDNAFRGSFSARGGSAKRQQTAFQTRYSMTEATDRSDAVQGIEGVMLANRDRIVRFLEVRGAGVGAEDLFQDLWMRLTQRPTGPIAQPLSYIMRAANNLMLDRYRSARQSELRDHAWSDSTNAHPPSAETSLIAREQLARVEQAITATGDRPARIFRRFRVDDIAQRDIAAEMGVSLSTVEADLRKVYAALAAIRRQFDAN